MPIGKQRQLRSWCVYLQHAAGLDANRQARFWVAGLQSRRVQTSVRLMDCSAALLGIRNDS